MVRSPESLISRLRNRKARVLGYSVLVIAALGLLALNWVVALQAYAQLEPAEGVDLVMHVVLSQPLVVGIALMQTISIALAIGLGGAVALWIGEVATFTKNDLLVHLWDRVQALEHGRPDPGTAEPQEGPDALR